MRRRRRKKKKKKEEEEEEEERRRRRKKKKEHREEGNRRLWSFSTLRPPPIAISIVPILITCAAMAELPAEPTEKAAFRPSTRRKTRNKLSSFLLLLLLLLLPPPRLLPPPTGTGTVFPISLPGGSASMNSSAPIFRRLTILPPARSTIASRA
jgi:hypothetical protein